MSHYGVDLDGTLAHQRARDDHDPASIGEPVLPMLKRVKDWLAAGQEVRIFTARVGPHKDETYAVIARKAIAEWCVKHVGQELPITATKDHEMVQIWDDRAVQVMPNTGASSLQLLDLLRIYQTALETVKADTALHAKCGPTYEAVCAALG